MSPPRTVQLYSFKLRGHVLDRYDSFQKSFKVQIIAELEDIVIAIQEKLEHNGELHQTLFLWSPYYHLFRYLFPSHPWCFLKKISSEYGQVGCPPLVSWGHLHPATTARQKMFLLTEHVEYIVYKHWGCCAWILVLRLTFSICGHTGKCRTLQHTVPCPNRNVSI